MPSEMSELRELFTRARTAGDGVPQNGDAERTRRLVAPLLGVEVPRARLAELAAQPRPALAMANLPAAVDWRNINGHNHISPVKDQEQCGSCVSFCTTATIESLVSVATGETVDLSEADLHFCSNHGASCGGWWPSDALDEAKRRGLPPESAFPYKSAFDAAGSPSCKLDPGRDNVLYFPTGYTTLNTTAERKQWLATRGPVAAAFHVYDDFFNHTGVYRHTSGESAGYHCVEVIGYNDADRCWIAKNSWGEWWNDDGFFSIGYGECGIDETSTDRDPDGSVNRFPMYGVEGVKLPGGWRNFELGGANSAAPNGAITAVARIPGSMEVWWTGPSGFVQDAFWYDGGAWGGFQLSGNGSAAPTGPIASVSRIPGSMEIWWIAANGSVQAAFWYEGGNWGRYELAPAGSAAPGGGIAAVSRIPGSMEVWWVGPNGSVQDAYWYEGGNWGRFELAPAGSASTSGAIAAASRIPNSMEIWWIGPNGSVQDAYWYEGGNWGRFELAPGGSAATNGEVVAVSRIPNSMEIWWIGANGSIQDAYWYEGGNWGRFELAPGGSAANGGGITAVSRIPGSMEVWWVGPNGSVQDAYWYDGGNWGRFELAPGGSAATEGGITAVSRIPNSMEVWWIAPNGAVRDAYWYA